MTDEEYVASLKEYEVWYEKAAGVWWYALMACRIIVFGSTVAAAVLALCISPTNGTWLRWYIAVVSLVGALATNLLAEFRVAKMEALRDAGRREAQHLVSYANDKLEQYRNDPDRRFKVKDEIRFRVQRMEESQGREFTLTYQGSFGDSGIKDDPPTRAF